jgi:hypothetical protein
VNNVDYEKMWNELKGILDTESDDLAIPIFDRMVRINVLETMRKLNTKHTTIYIKELQSTRP